MHDRDRRIVLGHAKKELMDEDRDCTRSKIPVCKREPKPYRTVHLDLGVCNWAQYDSAFQAFKRAPQERSTILLKNRRKSDEKWKYFR